MTLKEAIEVLKVNRPILGRISDDMMEAVDTVVAELEKPLPTNEQIQDAFNERFPIDIFNATINQCFKQGLYFSGFSAGISFMIGRKEAQK